jgi:hypothetical protein
VNAYVSELAATRRASLAARRLAWIQLAGQPSGTFRGKPAVEGYWRKALALFPDLHFQLVSVLIGVTSITLYYRGARGRLAADVFHFDTTRNVSRAFAPFDARL